MHGGTGSRRQPRRKDAAVVAVAAAAATVRALLARLSVAASPVTAAKAAGNALLRRRRCSRHCSGRRTPCLPWHVRLRAHAGGGTAASGAPRPARWIERKCTG